MGAKNKNVILTEELTQSVRTLLTAEFFAATLTGQAYLLRTTGLGHIGARVIAVGD